MSADFAAALTAWFDATARELPWRGASVTPWQVLVSEFMLQQTQVERVWPRYEEWIATWPTPAALAAAALADALRAWDRLGYPRRALWLHRAAIEIVDRFAGRVPDTPEELESLTGVGPYTARAVAAFAHGQRYPVVDTNTRRVLARAVKGVAAAGNPSPADLTLQESLLPADREQSVTFNAAMMELGQTVCAARQPRCGQCPIAAWCQWRGAGYPENAPRARRGQAKFEGSDRQARGKILSLLRAASHPVAVSEALAEASVDAAQASRALTTLTADGLVERHGDMLRLPGDPHPEHQLSTS